MTGALRDQDPGWTHEWIDDVPHAQRKLLDTPGHSGTNDRFSQFHFGLLQFRFSSGLLGRENGVHPLLGILLCGLGGLDGAEVTIQAGLKPLDVPLRHVTRTASLQFLLGRQFIQCLLARALGVDTTRGVDWIEIALQIAVAAVGISLVSGGLGGRRRGRSLL